MDYLKLSGFVGGGRIEAIYMAPDGRRFEYLQDGQRYVRMMVPIVSYATFLIQLANCGRDVFVMDLTAVNVEILPPQY